GGIDIISAGDISLGLASGEPLDGFLALMRRHLARSSKPHAALLGSLTPLAGPGADQLALELSQATEPGEHQPTVGARGRYTDMRGFQPEIRTWSPRMPS